MSQENVAIVRRAFEAYTGGDIDTVLRLCAEDIVITQAAEVPGVSPQQRGHEGVLEAFGIWPEQWDDFQIEIQRIVADPGDYVVVATRQRGRGKQSGVEVGGEFTFVFTVRAAKIAEWRIFVHESQALAATRAREVAPARRREHRHTRTRVRLARTARAGSAVRVPNMGRFRGNAR